MITADLCCNGVWNDRSKVVMRIPDPRYQHQRIAQERETNIGGAFAPLEERDVQQQHAGQHCHFWSAKCREGGYYRGDPADSPAISSLLLTYEEAHQQEQRQCVLHTA